MTFVAIVSLLIIVLFSIIVIRIGTIALVMTGLSREVAYFQALSAFTGVGFTTSEAEYVVSHPVRRKIIKTLMLMGSVGITSAIASLVLAFVGTTTEQVLRNGLWLGSGLLSLYFLSRSQVLDKLLGFLMEKMLKRYTSLRLLDYEHVLGLSKGYTITVVRVRRGSWLEGRTLGELKLQDEGVIVLGIYRRTRSGEIYIGAPREDTKLVAGDRIICYGPEEVLSRLPERLKGPRGDMEHVAAVAKHKVLELVEEEEARKAEEEAIEIAKELEKELSMRETREKAET